MDSHNVSVEEITPSTYNDGRKKACSYTRMIPPRSLANEIINSSAPPDPKYTKTSVYEDVISIATATSYSSIANTVIAI